MQKKKKNNKIVSQHTPIVCVIYLGHFSLYNGCRRIRLKYQPAKLICCPWSPKDTACSYNGSDIYPGQFLYYSSTGWKAAFAVVFLLLCVAVAALVFSFLKHHQASPVGGGGEGDDGDVAMLPAWNFSPSNKTLVPVLDLQWSPRVPRALVTVNQVPHY